MCLSAFETWLSCLKTNRNMLYEGLEDHETVKSYPDVQGMVRNLFFITHSNKENGRMDDMASKYNTYEVRKQFVS